DRVIFTHDTEQSLHAAAALVNTDAARSASKADELGSVGDLATFVARYRYSGSFTGSVGELHGVRDLRPEFLRFWELDRDHSVGLINAMLRQARALPQLVRHDGWDWHLHAAESDAPFATRLRVETAMAMVDVIRSDEHRRLRRCEADDCDAVFVDLSRNRSKRFCDVGNCGNRMHVAAYRARQGTGHSHDSPGDER
ncbi:MAG: CGNR zinc finger domain-containing protein, partial [Microthrixaceae bacterium]|nr:CGNR zinc finger domain-containing protein [Microthrixaceae bacterium]